MRVLQAMMMLIGALAVLWTGVVPAGALADATSPPCHETATHGGGGETPGSGKATAMGCCVACVAAPLLKPPARPG